MIPALLLMVAEAPLPAAKPATLQQDFDAASTAFGNGDCETALPILARLIASPKVKAGSLPAAVAGVRQGICLYRTGEAERGRTLIEAGLPLMRKSPEVFRFDISDAEQVIANIAFAELDYTGSAAHFRAALEGMEGTARLNPLIGLARATTFDGDGAAVTTADEAIGIAAAQPATEKEYLARLHTLRGRALLNLGKVPEANAALKEALRLNGGLTTKTNLTEVPMRADLAQAALLAGKTDEAFKYLAYTGAGRISESPFDRAAAMEPPVCGEETGLKPEDSAVVEFSIGTDGAVFAAHTVYTRGGPKVATAFAKAVRNWYWQPESIAAIPRFYTLLTRIELRCTKVGGGLPSFSGPLYDRFGDWAEEQLKTGRADDRSLDDWLNTYSAKVIEMRGAGDPEGEVAALGMLAILEPRISSDRHQQLIQAIVLADKHKMPIEVGNALRVIEVQMQEGLFDKDYWLSSGKPSGGRKFAPDTYVKLAAEPALAVDPLAADTLLMFAAQPRQNVGDSGQLELVAQVANDTRLGEHHPLRQFAQLRLANAAAARGDAATAERYFQATGLSEQQCALIGPKPVMNRNGASSSDYPDLAQRYGFEGWLKMEFDIDATGRANQTRTLIAYPPFAFSDASTGISRGLRYQASYRPGGSPACTANRELVRFQIE